jgi:hypothetical protein
VVVLLNRRTLHFRPIKQVIAAADRIPGDASLAWKGFHSTQLARSTLASVKRAFLYPDPGRALDPDGQQPTAVPTI